MRIAHLVGHAGLNGVATSSRALIQAQLDAGHDVMLVHMPNSWIGRQAFAGRIDRVESSLKTSPAELRRVGYAIRDWGEDVVHAHGSKGNKHAMVYRLAAGTPIVMTAHARKLQLPWMFAHAVIAPSPDTAAFYRDRWMVRPSRLHGLRHIFDVKSVSQVTDESRATARRSLGIRENAVLLGFLGELSVRKNQTDVLKVLRAAVRAGVDAEAVLVGRMADLGDDADWQAISADPELAGRIHLTGARDDAGSLLHALDIYVCASKVEEGPVATYEAMSAGLPVVTSDVGYSRHVIEQGISGWVVGHGDVDRMAALAVALAGDDALRRSVGAAARLAIGRELCAARVLPELDAIYRTAMRRAGLERVGG